MQLHNSKYFSQYVLYNSPFTSFKDTSTAFINTAKLAATFLATRPLKSLLSLAAKSNIKLTYQLLNALNVAALIVLGEFKLYF